MHSKFNPVNWDTYVHTLATLGTSTVTRATPDVPSSYVVFKNAFMYVNVCSLYITPVLNMGRSNFVGWTV